MYGSTDGNNLVELKESEFEKEKFLQDFLTQNPALLSGDQMDPGNPRRFILIGTEAGIAIAKGGGNYFSLDHLFIDQDGIPTLVEVKRSSDPRLRREVIGQILEYAANASAFWGVTEIRTMFERRLGNDPQKIQQELEILTLGDETPDVIWNRVDQNLQDKRLRLVLLADKIQPETQRIIEFLNEQTREIEVYAIEVRYYTGGGIKTLVPRVLNPSATKAEKRSIAATRGESWSNDRFYADLDHRHGSRATKVFREIQEWAESRPGMSTAYGRGKSDGSIYFLFNRISIFTLWTFGFLEIEFQYLMKSSSFAPELKRIELWERLTSGSNLSIARDRIAQRPSIVWSVFEDPANLNVFKNAVDWVTLQLSLE
jgi:hypothetical protein